MVAGFIEQATEMLALALEGMTALIIAIGAVSAVIAIARGVMFDASGRWRRTVWAHFASWLLLALEFALAADICRTAISPSWDDIGKLAVIAVVRTALNYFLKDDLEDLTAEEPGGVEPR